MEITSEPVEPRQVKLTIPIPESRLDEARRNVARELARRHKVPGYRPENTPISRIKSIVGDEAFEQEALEVAARRAVQMAAEQESLRPSAPVSIERTGDDPMVIEALVPLAPQVELGDYAALRVPVPPQEPVDDERIDAIIEGWRRERAFLEPADRAAEEGDVMSLKLVGRLDDEMVYEDESLQLPLSRDEVSGTDLPPDVVDELIGLSAGEAAAFDVTYSEFWPQSEVQGQSVHFEAEVEGVHRVSLPELDGAFAEEIADVESVDELRERVRAELAQRQVMDEQEQHVERMVQALVDHADISYPPQLLRGEMEQVVGQLRDRVEKQGFRWDRWLEMQQDKEEDILEDLEAEARQRLERSLVLSRFIESEGIGVSKEEIAAEAESFRDMMSPQARRGLPSKDEFEDYVAQRLLSRRAIQRMMELMAEPSEDAADHGASPDVPVVELPDDESRSQEVLLPGDGAPEHGEDD